MSIGRLTRFSPQVKWCAPNCGLDTRNCQNQHLALLNGTSPIVRGSRCPQASDPNQNKVRCRRFDSVGPATGRVRSQLSQQGAKRHRAFRDANGAIKPVDVGPRRWTLLIQVPRVEPL